MVRPVIAMNKILNLEDVVDYIYSCSTYQELTEIENVLKNSPIDELNIANQIMPLLDLIDQNKNALLEQQKSDLEASKGNNNVHSKVISMNPVSGPRSHYSHSTSIDNRGLAISILLICNVGVTIVMYTLLAIAKIIGR